MKPTNSNPLKLSQLAAWFSHLTVARKLLASLTMLSVATFALLSSSACFSLLPSPTSQPTLSPSPSAAPLFTPYTRVPTLTPALLSPVVLEEPEDGSCLACQSDVTLQWSCPYTLPPGACYRVRVKGSNSPLHVSDTYHAQNYAKLSDLSLGQSPGQYKWAVTVVSAINANDYVPVSWESVWYGFEVVPPPVVHSISPTCTVKGTTVPVTVTGEHFTHSPALTIAVPLTATFVNTSTITATIPITLEVGQYPVVVRDSLGQGESYAFFTVSEQPTPTPVPATPRPICPRPVLGGLDFHGHDVTFHWSWSGILTANDHFALRVGIGTPGESKLWTKETQASWSFTEQGNYVWEVAICRGDPAAGDCSGDTELVVSERATFWFTPPPPPKDTPKPP